MNTRSSMPVPEFPSDCKGFEEEIKLSAKFRNWMSGLEHGVNNGDWILNKITIHNVLFFGKSSHRKVGYILAQVDGCLPDGTLLPGITFIRGDSVAILPVLTTPDGKQWTVVTEQVRIGVGSARYSEIPAGMVDEGEVKSKALDELQEETGENFHVSADELVELDKVHPSPGGCDEQITVYAFFREVDEALPEKMNGRVSGAVNESERIKLRIVPLDNLISEAPYDMKSHLALYGLRRYENENSLSSGFR